MNLLKAQVFALKAHKEQKYGQDLPYFFHLSNVAEVLLRFGIKDPELLQASYLHDTIEDVDVKLEEIVKEFGDRVGKLVYAVTNEPGKNRKERHLLTYPKIQQFPEAITLKLADRIANVEYSIWTKAPQLGMYKKEHKDFKEALYPFHVKYGFEKYEVIWNTYELMWRYLDDLIKDN